MQQTVSPIRGLRHWAGEPGGRPGAESPSRRTNEPASARKTSPPRSRRPQGLFRARCASAMPRSVLPCSAFRLLSSLSHSRVGNWQWPEPPSFVDASARSLATPEEPPLSWGRITQALRRGARVTRDSPPRTPRPTSAFVWCGDTPASSGHSAIDASDTSASRAEGARRPASPKGPIKREPRDPQQARGATEGRAVRTAPSTVDSPRGLPWFHGGNSRFFLAEREEKKSNKRH